MSANQSNFSGGNQNTQKNSERTISALNLLDHEQMQAGRSVHSCHCGNVHFLAFNLEDSADRAARMKQRRKSYSDSDATQLNGQEIGPRSIVIRDAASVHATGVSYILYYLNCKTCHCRFRIAVSQGTGFIQEIAPQNDQECASSLVTDIPIQLRGFFEFDPTYAAKIAREDCTRDTTYDMDEPDEWDADPRAIVGSFQQSGLMDFVSWETPSVPFPNSVP
jgi:hypothetical protein